MGPKAAGRRQRGRWRAWRPEEGFGRAGGDGVRGGGGCDRVRVGGGPEGGEGPSPRSSEEKPLPRRASRERALAERGGVGWEPKVSSKRRRMSRKESGIWS